jgi:predicted nucleic acid-binding Zn ribbon protein
MTAQPAVAVPKASQTRTCPGCSLSFEPSRVDQVACSSKCRKRLARARKREEREAVEEHPETFETPIEFDAYGQPTRTIEAGSPKAAIHWSRDPRIWTTTRRSW